MFPRLAPTLVNHQSGSHRVLHSRCRHIGTLDRADRGRCGRICVRSLRGCCRWSDVRDVGALSRLSHQWLTTRSPSGSTSLLASSRFATAFVQFRADEHHRDSETPPPVGLRNETNEARHDHAK